MNPRARKVIAVLLLLAGIEAWLLLGRGFWIRDFHPLVVVTSLAAMLIPVVRRRTVAVLRAVARPSPRVATATSVAIAVAASGYFIYTAARQGAGFYPKLHDEFPYLTQASMLARGRLWMPRHALADFFDTIYMLNEPVYSAQSPPGTPLLLVPAVWLHWPHWVIPVAAAGAAVGLLYRVALELFDGAAALLAALLLAGVSTFRWHAVMATAEAPILLAGLFLALAWLKWRDGQRPAWALAVGAAAGWAAITRPIDALCLVAPIGVAMAIALRHRPPRFWCKTSAYVLAGAVPFLALQVVYNFGVTGNPLRFPATLYNARDQPLLAYGFPAYDPTRLPVSPLPQKRRLYEQWVLPAARQHTWANGPAHLAKRSQMAFESAVAHPLLILLMPLGVTAMGRRQRWALWAAVPLCLLLYTPYTLFLPHYAILIAPALALTLAGAVEALKRAWPDHPGVPAAAFVAVAALTVSALPEFDRRLIDDFFPAPTMAAVARLPAQVDAPAIVLFRYAAGANVHEEPVYNPDVAWPDDAPIIHAHDLGPQRDIELFRYYAKRQPSRRVYRFDRADGSLTYLGSVADLAARGSRASSD